MWPAVSIDKEKNNLSLPRASSTWDHRIHEIMDIAEPIYLSDAFQRLHLATFLGILSPRFRDISNSPIYRRKQTKNTFPDDGDRLNHSLGVALLFLDMAKDLGMSKKAQRYAVAWGLLHDVATWPLSHTSEPAFSELTKTSSHELRVMIIKGSKCLPSNFSLNNELKELGVKPDVLINLFQDDPCDLDPELKVIWQIAKSPINPDTLEGIWRTGLSFGEEVPHPSEVQKAISKGLFGAIVVKQRSSDVLLFWRRKSLLYEKYINRSQTIKWESSWSLGLKNIIGTRNLFDSLFLSEKGLIDNVLSHDLPVGTEVNRYKVPLTYRLGEKGKNKRALLSDQPLLYLRDIFRKEKKEQAHYESGEARSES